ncbi:hypothetical protein D0T87_02055 [Bacteroides sp. 51]|nr:hypothetical protein [Bacteroides sp. 51]
MKNNWTEKEYRMATILSIYPWLGIVLIGVVAIIKSCIAEDIEPIDNSINKSREIVSHVEVVDSTKNGFRVVYGTASEVTKERLNEIISREHIGYEFQRIKTDALLHYGSLLNTDIYDFARFITKYKIDSDIMIHNIFVSGKEKSHLYIGPNPRINNPATFISPLTEQGIQYINHQDVWGFIRTGDRIYRYWKCKGLNELSRKDERFSHFSEDERLW